MTWPSLPRFSASAMATCVMWKKKARPTAKWRRKSVSPYFGNGFAMMTRLRLRRPPRREADALCSAPPAERKASRDAAAFRYRRDRRWDRGHRLRLLSGAPAASRQDRPRRARRAHGAHLRGLGRELPQLVA